MLSRRLNELTAPIQELSKSSATNPLALVKKEHQPDSGIDTKKVPLLRDFLNNLTCLLHY